MREIKPIIKVVPLGMLGFCCFMTAFTGFSWYHILYDYASQIVGFGIVTNVYFLYFAYRFNMCMYTKVAVIGLIALNILDIWNLASPVGSVYLLYNSIIGYFFFIISFLFLAFKNEPKDGTTS